MAQRWSAERVRALVPDAAAFGAGAALAAPNRWRGTGSSGSLVWGSCSGSAAHPYQVLADIDAPAFRCSCPSRKVPCKHAVGLLLLWSAGDVADAGEPADFAASWQQSRATPRSRSAKPGVRDEVAAAKRAAQRADRVTAGLAELETWLRDQVRTGLAGATYGYTEPAAARMVDAQAPGVAGTLRGIGTLPASGAGWPERLLGAYGRLHLLIRAHEKLDELPDDLAATVRAHVGYPTPREHVRTRPPVRDEWHVLAVRTLLDTAVPARRIWLRGRHTDRAALLLVFDPSGEFADNADATLRPGIVVDADLHFYPGRPALRALVGERHGEAYPAAAPHPDSNLPAALDTWARALEQDPWLSEWPAVLFGTPVPGAQWQLAEPGGVAVPLLAGGSDPWVLAAVSGGAPVVVAGEWTAGGLRPLTVWHGDEAVPV